jgi:hypothetical protein
MSDMSCGWQWALPKLMKVKSQVTIKRSQRMQHPATAKPQPCFFRFGVLTQRPYTLGYTRPRRKPERHLGVSRRVTPERRACLPHQLCRMRRGVWSLLKGAYAYLKGQTCPRHDCAALASAYHGRAASAAKKTAVFRACSVYASRVMRELESSPMSPPCSPSWGSFVMPLRLHAWERSQRSGPSTWRKI